MTWREIFQKKNNLRVWISLHPASTSAVSNILVFECKEAQSNSLDCVWALILPIIYYYFVFVYLHVGSYCVLALCVTTRSVSFSVSGGFLFQSEVKYVFSVLHCKKITVWIKKGEESGHSAASCFLFAQSAVWNVSRELQQNTQWIHLNQFKLNPTCNSFTFNILYLFLQ